MRDSLFSVTCHSCKRTRACCIFNAILLIFLNAFPKEDIFDALLRVGISDRLPCPMCEMASSCRCVVALAMASGS